jgi:hypothetical protein
LTGGGSPHPGHDRLGAGLGATYPLILKAWSSKDVKYQMYCLVEAANNETRVLLPGAMATGVTGFFWGVSQEYNFVKEGWLAALTGLYIFFYFVCHRYRPRAAGLSPTRRDRGVAGHPR